jgi:hypothetical protein
MVRTVISPKDGFEALTAQCAAFHSVVQHSCCLKLSAFALSINLVIRGGEDNDFFARVSKKLNIIRLHETGLTHVW